jgi:hypothetical protein
MTIDNETIKDKIRKLLNLAGNEGAFDGEVDNCLRLARKLMLKHNIKEDEVRLDPENMNAGKTTYGSMDVFSFGRDMAKWEGVLLQVIAKLVGTISAYRNSGLQGKQMNTKTGKTHTRLTFYGPLADVQDAVEIYEEWSRIIVSLARMKTGAWVRQGGRSYCEGFVSALYVKVTTIEKEENTEVATGKSLILRDAKAIMAEKRVEGDKWLAKERGVRLKQRKSHFNRGDDPHMFQKGKEDGSNADFSRTVKPKLT